MHKYVTILCFNPFKKYDLLTFEKWGVKRKYHVIDTCWLGCCEGLFSFCTFCVKLFPGIFKSDRTLYCISLSYYQILIVDVVYYSGCSSRICHLCSACLIPCLRLSCRCRIYSLSAIVYVCMMRLFFVCWYPVQVLIADKIWACTVIIHNYRWIKLEGHVYSSLFLGCKLFCHPVLTAAYLKHLSGVFYHNDRFHPVLDTLIKPCIWNCIGKTYLLCLCRECLVTTSRHMEGCGDFRFFILYLYCLWFTLYILFFCDKHKITSRSKIQIWVCNYVVSFSILYKSCIKDVELREFQCLTTALTSCRELCLSSYLFAVYLYCLACSCIY